MKQCVEITFFFFFPHPAKSTILSFRQDHFKLTGTEPTKNYDDEQQRNRLIKKYDHTSVTVVLSVAKYCAYKFQQILNFFLLIIVLR